MFGKCPVVRIEYDNQDGFLEINESDYNEDIHKLFRFGDKDSTETKVVKKNTKAKTPADK